MRSGGVRLATIAAMVVAAMVAASACAAGDGSPPAVPVTPPGVVVPPGFTVTEVASGFDGPTQLAPAPDGRFVLAELHGPEDAGTGRVLLVDLNDPGTPPQALFEGLRKPTGVAVLDDGVWIQQEHSLAVGPLDGGELEVVLDDLPFNGRSEGTLTVGPPSSPEWSGALLYETSGDLGADGTVTEGSGAIWAVRPGGGLPTPVATGLKNGYGRTFDGDGVLWQTEVAEGTFDGEEAPDELVAVTPGDDLGWPRCVGDARPAPEHGGDAATCAGTRRPHALFDPGATPTSVAVAPWDPDTLLVALWNAGTVVAVTRTGDGLAEPEPFLTGIEHPQDLLADGDRLLVVDHGGGRILAVSRAS